MVWIHNIDPIAFYVPIINYPIAWYGLAYVFGILVGLYQVRYLVKKYHLPYTNKQLDSFINYLVIGIILGGRLGEVLFYGFTYYMNHPGEIIAIWKGGLSFHGGLIGVVVSFLVFTYRNKCDFWSFADLVATAAPIVIFLGRIANFINGELYGRKTDLSIGVIFPYSGGIPRHPSQLYEALLEGVVLWVILFATYSPQRRKLSCGLFLFFYGLFRISVEFLREPNGMFLSFSYGQWLSLPMLFLGAFILFSRNTNDSDFLIKNVG